jgi:cytochrome c553
MRLNDPQTLFQATIDNPKAVTGNVLEEGRLVVVGGSHQGGAGMACMSCHGAQGEGDNGAAFPRLAGLPAWYIYKQLDDYASGTRKNEVMSQIAQKLTDAERRAAASYYAVLTAPYPQLSLLEDAKTLQWGGQLAAVGSVNKDVPACTNCHGAKGEGVPPSVPYLSGQHAEYIIA